MTSKKTIAYIGAILLTIQSPLSVLAAAPAPTPTLQEAVLEGFMEGYNNPKDTLDEGLDELKPTPREQFHIDRITKHLQTIINKAPTNEEKIQKAMNVNVYLLDSLVASSKGLMEKAIAGQDNPLIMLSVEKEMISTQFKSKVKIIMGAIMQISKKYLTPQIDIYMKFVEEFQDEPNQKDIDTATQKISSLVNMADIAFEKYAPTINQLMKDNIGIGTKELFHHSRVISLFALQMMIDEETQYLDPTDKYDATDIAEKDLILGYIKNSLLHSDEKTKSAYTIYNELSANSGTILTYWNSIKGAFNKEFAEKVDMFTELSSDFSE